jgi:cbb3-type cytochrome oxidase subunit 3
MYQKLLSGSDLLILPQIGLAIFFLTFVAVLAHVVIAHRKGDRLAHMAELPLDDTEIVSTLDGKREV